MRPGGYQGSEFQEAGPQLKGNIWMHVWGASDKQAVPVTGLDATNRGRREKVRSHGRKAGDVRRGARRKGTREGKSRSSKKVERPGDQGLPACSWFWFLLHDPKYSEKPMSFRSFNQIWEIFLYFFPSVFSFIFGISIRENLLN